MTLIRFRKYVIGGGLWGSEALSASYLGLELWTLCSSCYHDCYLPPWFPVMRTLIHQELWAQMYSLFCRLPWPCFYHDHRKVTNTQTNTECSWEWSLLYFSYEQTMFFHYPSHRLRCQKSVGGGFLYDSVSPFYIWLPRRFYSRDCYEDPQSITITQTLDNEDTVWF